MTKTLYLIACSLLFVSVQFAAAQPKIPTGSEFFHPPVQEVYQIDPAFQRR